MIKNRLGILVPDTPVMREIYPRLPNETPIPVVGYDPRIKPLKVADMNTGDMLFYDKSRHAYAYVEQAAIAAVLADLNTERYETNYDTYVGTLDGVMHFVANNDAVQGNALYSDNVAATSCFYRLEIDNTANGTITFSATSGNASIASTTISWTAGDTMADIVALFVAKNASYITFAALEDGKGVGCEVGGYGANTLTVSGEPTGCTVIDCSGLAMLASSNAGIAVGGSYNPAGSYTYLGQGTHHNFCGATARSILGTVCKDANSVCLAVDGYNYSYRCGANFAKWKAWASINGESTYFDDGEDEDTSGTHIADPGAHVMKEATFNAGVRDYVDGTDPDPVVNSHHLGMKDFYTHLYSDATGEYAELRAEYEAMYGTMTSMYDAYLMNHIIDPAANSGITADLRNYGMTQTAAKADCLNVNYNYKFIPAYPPEYNAQQYGVTSEGFSAGKYYHPEPGDIGLMFRDDLMAKINANIVAVGAGTQLNNSMYRGSCADYDSTYSWYFSGTYGCFTNLTLRSYGVFRSRPVLALNA